jgi:hypothetical protein
MRWNGKAVGCLLLAGVGAAAFARATQWTLASGLFPMIVSAALCLLALAELAFNLFAREGAGERGTGLDYQLSTGHDPKMARRKTLGVFLWCLTFFFLVLAAGFPIAVPLFVFLYLRISSKEGWVLSLSLSAVAGACFYGLFVWILNIHLNESWIEHGLRLLVSR